jgi:hypothetical protein
MAWKQILIWVATAVLTYALTPRPKIPKDRAPATIDDFDFPTAEDGREIPVLFGTREVSGPNVVWFGDLRTGRIREKVDRGLFRSSKRVTVGYKYFLGMHKGLVHGPVDSLNRIRVADKVVWVGSLTGNQSVEISRPEMFGGTKTGGEGGIEGTFTFADGDPLQLASPYLQDNLGEPIPAFRGITCAILEQMYVTAFSPYLKPWAFYLTRTDVTTFGQTQWHVEKARIGGGGSPEGVTGVQVLMVGAGGSISDQNTRLFGGGGAGQIRAFRLVLRDNEEVSNTQSFDFEEDGIRYKIIPHNATDAQKDFFTNQRRFYCNAGSVSDINEVNGGNSTFVESDLAATPSPIPGGLSVTALGGYAGVSTGLVSGTAHETAPGRGGNEKWGAGGARNRTNARRPSDTFPITSLDGASGAQGAGSGSGSVLESTPCFSDFLDLTCNRTVAASGGGGGGGACGDGQTGGASFNGGARGGDGGDGTDAFAGFAGSWPNLAYLGGGGGGAGTRFCGPRLEDNCPDPDRGYGDNGTSPGAVLMIDGRQSYGSGASRDPQSNNYLPAGVGVIVIRWQAP